MAASGNIDRTHYLQEAQALGLDEFQGDHHIIKQAALTWIKQNPGRALGSLPEKNGKLFQRL